MVTFEVPVTPDEQEFKSPPLSTTVLIVGGGPCGFFAALLLAKFDIKSTVLERRGFRLGQPKAHAINPRTLEIFRQIGLDTRKVRSIGIPAAESFWVRFLTVATGLEIGKLAYERQDEAVKEVTPEPLLNISQPLLENFLQKAATKTDLVTICRRWEWTGSTLTVDGKLISHVVNHDMEGEYMDVYSDFIIGADGANSRVRSVTRGIEWVSLPGHQQQRRDYVSIHARGALRPKMERLERQAQLYFCMHPKHSAGIICYNLDSSWVYARPVNPSVEPIQSFTQERCRQLIDGAIGAEVPYKVASVDIWATDTRVASNFADPTLRIFLVGDAAHSFPPQGGLGINTGIGDVHNLCWKLDRVVHGRGANATRLLSSYSLERKPVAIANALQSLVNEDRWEAMRTVIADIFSMTDLDDFHRVEETFRRLEVAARVQEQLDLNKVHFDSLALQLGYIYDGDDGTKLLENCSLFIPAASRGARMPHAWIGDNRSTLDLLSYEGFTLLHYSELDLAGPSYEVEYSTILVNMVLLDGILVPKEWKRLVGIRNGSSGLLVRPDGHILAHVSSKLDVISSLKGFLFQ